MIKKLNKSFHQVVTSFDYFRHWTKEKPREYWHRSPEYVQGIYLQIDKYWETNGGKFAINLCMGHKWSVPNIGSGRSGEIEIISTRLSEKMTGDAWWSVYDERQLENAITEVKDLVHLNAIPWFEEVNNKLGYLEWQLSTYGQYSFLRDQLEVYGTDVFRGKICEWLMTYPRGIERTLEWLVLVGIITADVSARLRLASIQAIDDYREMVPSLLSEIQLGGGTQSAR